MVSIARTFFFNVLRLLRILDFFFFFNYLIQLLEGVNRPARIEWNAE